MAGRTVRVTPYFVPPLPEPDIATSCGGSHLITVQPAEDGSTLGLRFELGGRALFGPVGSAAARAVKGDVEKSLKQFRERYC